MSNSHNRPPEVGRAPSARTHTDMPAQLIHELAGLLDASLRNVGLVMSSLGDIAPFSADAHSAHAAELDETALLDRLGSVDVAMRQMATLLQRWREGHTTADELFSQSKTLGQAIEHAVRMIVTQADASDVSVNVQIAPAAADLPAGPMYSVISNALRNSVDAFARQRADNGPRRIEVSADVNKGAVMLSVCDTGPGVDDSMFAADGVFRFGCSDRHGGQGIGLSLSRQIIAELGGNLAITNRDPRGAVLTARLPLSSLVSGAHAA